MIWSHGEESLKQFLQALNNCHRIIKFTADYSREKINFLDVQVTKCRNQLGTDLYTKPTDTRQYLEASSCHVYHSKASIPLVRHLDLTEFALIIINLIKDAMN